MFWDKNLKISKIRDILIFGLQKYFTLPSNDLHIVISLTDRLTTTISITF